MYKIKPYVSNYETFTQRGVLYWNLDNDLVEFLDSNKLNAVEFHTSRSRFLMCFHCAEYSKL